jgi:putative drug exporter of the RND superfamily
VAIVQRSPSGLSRRTQARVAGAAELVSRHRVPLLRTIRLAIPVTNTAKAVPGSRERGTTAITFLFFRPHASLGAQNALAHTYEHRYFSRLEDSAVGVTGAVPARVQGFHEIEHALPLIEVATVLLIALILGASFRCPGVPLITLATAGIAFVIADHAIGWAGRALHQTVPRDAKPITVALMLGIVTDYTVFFFTSARPQLGAGRERREATRRTVGVYAPIVVTAGLVVAAGTAALVAGTLGFLRAFGPAMAATVLIGLAVSVTLTPALLAILGNAVFWPNRGTADDAETKPRRPRIARFIRSRPIGGLVALVCVAGLAVPAAQLTHLKLGLRLIGSVPSGSEPARAAAAARKGFAPGILGPTELILERRGVAHLRPRLVRLERLLERQPHVAGVAGPREQPVRHSRSRRFGAALAPGGNAARYVLILDVDPESAPAVDAVRHVEAALPGLLSKAGLGDARFSLAGESALARDTVDSVITSIERIALVALLVNLVLLAIFLRSLVAPLYLLAASALGLAASLGITTWVFQGLLGHPDIAYFVPLAAGALLVSLGSDYNLFVVGRIWQETERRPLWESIAVAVPRTSKAIAIAGAALGGSFGLLAIVDLEEFRAFAFALGIGVLVDTFVVRALLVPALIALFGEAGLWPRRRPARLVEEATQPT